MGGKNNRKKRRKKTAGRSRSRARARARVRAVAVMGSERIDLLLLGGAATGRADWRACGRAACMRSRSRRGSSGLVGKSEREGERGGEGKEGRKEMGDGQSFIPVPPSHPDRNERKGKSHGASAGRR